MKNFNSVTYHNVLSVLFGMFILFMCIFAITLYHVYSRDYIKHLQMEIKFKISDKTHL